MFIIGMAGIVLGYTLLYYGYSMFQAYKSNSNPSTTNGGGGAPLSYLLGLSDIVQASNNGSKPPFNFGAGTGSAQPSSSTTGTGTTGGVQSV